LKLHKLNKQNQQLYQPLKVRNQMRIKVQRAEFHDLNVVVDGIGGNLPNRLPAPNKTIPDLQMHMTEIGLEVSTKGFTSLVPLANIKIAVYAKNQD
jgi:hypothetical protein